MMEPKSRRFNLVGSIESSDWDCWSISEASCGKVISSIDTWVMLYYWFFILPSKITRAEFFRLAEGASEDFRRLPLEEALVVFWTFWGFNLPLLFAAALIDAFLGAPPPLFLLSFFLT